MALPVITPNLTNIDDADSTSGWSGFNDGSGGNPSAQNETDIFIQGDAAVSVKISGSNQNKGVWYDDGSPGIDMTVTGRHFYIWINSTTPGGLDKRVQGGLYIKVASDASGDNWNKYYVGGGDVTDSGFVRYVIDLNKTPSETAGTPATLTSIRWFGAGINHNGTVKSENFIIDRIDYGEGLTITEGDSGAPANWEALFSDDNVIANKYGVVEKRGGVYFIKGTIRIGDASGPASTTWLDDSTPTVEFENPTYAPPPAGAWAAGIQEQSDTSEILAIASIAEGGTGYTVSDTLTVSGGTFTTAATLTVTSVNAGVIDGIALAAGGDYSVEPLDAVAVTGGTGTGATFNIGNSSGSPNWGTLTSTFTDDTVDLNDADAADVALYPAGAGVADAFYWGAIAPFPDMQINISTGAAGNHTIFFQYWNGVTWVEVASIDDSSSGLTTTGSSDIDWVLPADWKVTTINGQGPYYYVRAIRDNDTVTADAVATQGFVGIPQSTVDAPNLYKIIAQGNGTGTTDLDFGSVVGLGDDRQGVLGGTIRTAGPSWEFDAQADIADLDTVNLYGVTMIGAGEGVQLNGPSSKTKIVSSTFLNCGEVDPGSASNGAEILNATFIDPDTSALLFQNTTHNLKNLTFITSGDPATQHMVRFSVAGIYAFDNIQFFGDYSSATLFHTENSVNAVTEDSYPDSNQDSETTFGNGTVDGVAQSFTGSGGVLSRARFQLRKTLAPTGTMTAKVYAHSGVFGTSSIPTGSALATSNSFDVSTLTTSLTLVDFEFEDEFTLVNTTNYVITLEYSGGDGSNNVQIGTDTSAPTHGGNFATLATPTWTAVSGTDAVFFVFTGAIVTINASNGSNPSIDDNTGTPPGATIVVNTVTIEINGVTEGAQCSIHIDVGGGDAGTELMNKPADSTGKAQADFNFGGNQAVVARARSSGIISAAVADDGGAFADETLAARDRSTTNDIILFPASPVVNVDQYYFAGLTTFGELIVRVGTAGVGTYVLLWEYFNGTVWSTLTTTQADDFKSLDRNLIRFAKPGDWAATTVNSQGPYFYIRTRWVSGTMTTSPAGNNASVKVTKFIPFRQLNTIISTGLVITASWIEDVIA